jgi:hypothetical protein
VIESRENLALVAEAAQHRLRVHAALDELDRGLLLELPVGAPAQIDGAHAAAADPLHELPMPDPLADEAIGLFFEGLAIGPGDRRLDELSRRRVRREQGLDVPAEALVISASRAHEFIAVLWLDVERVVKDRFDGPQAVSGPRSVRSPQLCVQPRPRESPVAPHGHDRDVQRLGDLFLRETAEIGELDHPGLRSSMAASFSSASSSSTTSRVGSGDTSAASSSSTGFAPAPRFPRRVALAWSTRIWRMAFAATARKCERLA